MSYDYASAATDPMATALAPFERQFIDFGEAIRSGRKPLSSGADGYRALEVVTAIYDSCRKGYGGEAVAPRLPHHVPNAGPRSSFQRQSRSRIR